MSDRRPTCGIQVLTHLSLFSGIGGIDLAAECAGFKTIAFCEIDKYCQQVLKKHWSVPIIEDVHEITKQRISVITDSELMGRQARTRENIQSEVEEAIRQDIRNIRTESEVVADSPEWENNGRIPGIMAGEGGQRRCIDSAVEPSGQNGITLLSGGFPCQPHSVAGKRKASSDERDLWPEFRRVIGEIRPKWVLAENVPGLFSSDAGRFFGNILADLASLGYDAGWCTYGAVDVGALHRRDRVFIVAYSKQFRLTGQPVNGQRGDLSESACLCHTPIKGLPDWAGGKVEKPSPLTEFERRDGNGKQREVERDFRRMAHGISRRVDRLRALGNAVVPQQIYPVLKAIAEIERGL